MNLILNIDDLNINNLQFSESKNNIIIDGSFTKTYYSTENYILNGIFLNFEIKTNQVNKIVYYNDYHYERNDKYIMYFEWNENTELLQSIIDIEKKILEYYKNYKNCNKIPDFILKNHIMNKNLKYYKNIHGDMNKFYLKISGIWENYNHFGITYKIVECS